MKIEHRGSPEAKAPIHFVKYAQEFSNIKEHDEAICRNGSWHLKLTRDKSQVTCKVCKGLM